ncbi:hypothetical protein L0F63_005114 [Massospora cicadina]|nr:hypothetical protein L0F63_005114 [Massospora cicadina]
MTVLQDVLDGHKNELNELKELMVATSYELKEASGFAKLLTTSMWTHDNLFKTHLQTLEQMGLPWQLALDLTPSHTLFALLRRSIKTSEGVTTFVPHKQLPNGISASLDTYVMRIKDDLETLSENLSLAQCVTLSQHKGVADLISRLQHLLHQSEKAALNFKGLSKSNSNLSNLGRGINVSSLVTALYLPKPINEEPTLFEVADTDLVPVVPINL